MLDFPIVDSHVHLIDPGRLTYSWHDDLPSLARPWRPPDLTTAAAPTVIEKIVFVEVDVARSDRRAEVDWIVDLAGTDSRIQAIVASLALEEGVAIRGDLERLSETPLVKGIRRLIQSEPDPEFCVRPAFVEGVLLLAEFGFSFDICVRHYQLPSVVRLVRQCPEVRFILDHAGKPAIKDGLLDPWRDHIRELSALPNVVCKVSGLITEADLRNWTAGELKPYIDHVIECFGFGRVLYGGDWPMCLPAGSYVRWLEALLACLVDCSSADLRRLFHDNAVVTYMPEAST